MLSVSSQMINESIDFKQILPMPNNIYIKNVDDFALAYEGRSKNNTSVAISRARRANREKKQRVSIK